MTNLRSQDLERFYRLLDRLEYQHNCARLLSQCDGRMQWPQRGVISSESQVNTGTTQVPDHASFALALMH